MKRIILIVMLFLSFSTLAAASEEYLADTDFEPADFRGIRWQQSLEGLSGMVDVYREDDDSWIAVSRTGDEMRFGGAELESIEYIFVDGLLSMVAVVAVGEENWSALLDEAKSRYGRETVHVGDDYMWRFTNVMIMFSMEQEDQAVLFYRYIGNLSR